MRKSTKLIFGAQFTLEAALQAFCLPLRLKNFQFTLKIPAFVKMFRLWNLQLKCTLNLFQGKNLIPPGKMALRAFRLAFSH